MRLSRTIKLALALTLVACALPASAFGQATRTWVSGVGDDANPCSRTAPCRTLPGAISKTAAGGQISGLDGCGCGAVTINKSITIDLRRLWEPGVLTNIGNGITVNAAATDRVTLRGLNINGLNGGLNGIRIIQARSVRITDADIYNWTRSAISVENANANAKVSVTDSQLRDNGGNGVMVAPAVGNTARVTVRRNEIDDNTCGIVASRFGIGSAFNFSNNCAANGANTSTVVINAFGNSITDHALHGVLSTGSSATVRVARNDIVNNGGNGLAAVNSGSIISGGGNIVVDNILGNGAPTGTVTPVR